MPGPGPAPFTARLPPPFIGWLRPVGGTWQAVVRSHSYAEAVRESETIRAQQPGEIVILIEGRRPYGSPDVPATTGRQTKGRR